MAGAPATSKWGKVWVAIVGFGALALCLGVLVDNDSGSLLVPPPDPADQQATVDVLARAAAVHNICYGWELAGYSSVVDRGSNLGADVDVTSDPARCPRYVRVRATVYYTTSSSESNDSAVLTVRTVGVDRPYAYEPALERLGIGEDELVEEPGEAILAAARMLPLVVVEAGAASPAPTPTAPAASVPPAPKADNDLWRDRWGLLLTGGGMLLVAVLTLVLGAFLARRAAAAPTSARPPARSGQARRGDRKSVRAKKQR